MSTFLALLPFIISAVGSITASVAGNYINASTTEKVNQNNLAYSQGMTEAQWARDDTSLQRQVEDAKQAGLSPLNVVGAMNSSSPLNYMAQAPQMDISSLIGAFSSIDNIGNALQERYKEEKAGERLDKQLSASLKELEKKIQADKDLQQDQFNQDAILLGKQLTFQYHQLEEQSKAHAQDLESDRLIEISRQNQELYSQICNSVGISPQVEYVSSSDLSTYTTKLAEFMKYYNQWAKDSAQFSDDYNVTARSQSDSSGMGSNVAGVAGVNFSEGSQESATYDYEASRTHKLFKEYLKGAVFPILIDDTKWQSRDYKYEED